MYAPFVERIANIQNFSKCRVGTKNAITSLLAVNTARFLGKKADFLAVLA